MKFTKQLPDLIQAFFSERLTGEMNASMHTKASYSYTFQLLLVYAKKKLKKTASKLTLEDLSYKFIRNFLDYLTKDRKMKPQSLNIRLSAIRSFFHYIEHHLPEYGNLIKKVLAIKDKRADLQLIDFLDDKEVTALLNTPNQQSWLGRRDHCLLAVAIQTGFRLSELTSLRWKNVFWGEHAYVHCLGKGRKERDAMLGKEIAKTLHDWFKMNTFLPSDIVFPTAQGNQMSSDAFQRLVKKYTAVAVKSCPSLNNKKVTPHVLRHTMAMRLLHAGIGLAGIALCLGHDSFKSTYKYLQADVELKERIMSSPSEIQTKSSRFHPSNKTLKYLKGISNLNK
jgi:site-specific recombinase XerD